MVEICTDECFTKREVEWVKKVDVFSCNDTSIPDIINMFAQKPLKSQQSYISFWVFCVFSEK